MIYIIKTDILMININECIEIFYSKFKESGYKKEQYFIKIWEDNKFYIMVISRDINVK